jgi:two-component system response regulator VanR
MARILLVEDDPRIASFVRRGLEAEGHLVDHVVDIPDGIGQASSGNHDLLILDRMLPSGDGLGMCRALREVGVTIPVLLLTAKASLGEKVDGLRGGADDYLTKPFALRELVLRLRALERRPSAGTPPIVEVSGIRLDRFRREVFRDGHYVALTRKQFAVLDVLMTAGGGVVSAEDLLERAWDENADPFTNAVRITISTLRKRLGEPWVIETVPGVGYRMRT